MNKMGMGFRDVEEVQIWESEETFSLRIRRKSGDDFVLGIDEESYRFLEEKFMGSEEVEDNAAEE